MKQAIQKAIEGGWIPDTWEKYYDNSYEACVTRHKEYVLFLMAKSDPLFFQALGKALSWENKQHPHWRLDLRKEYDDLENKEGIESKRIHPWEAQMHNFTDHLIAEKDPELFFQELLK